ncbi:MAG: hypothetical protein LLP51_06270 [Halorhodospira halophila]|uniref:hypothetical protein n=1 Tax=Halorhodospira TaxID=85108 RepID=UPI0019132135|nr:MULTISPECIES: hypothetical protein [Halorhodospira]MBK5936439.1 hypothetical protein [Halorhodospira halophila]MBK5943953.1 hypothetical protein [Halorhodospira halophila]MCC3750983.1 hypothetical protein [Halorhodospira halophila]MCG5527932.1 hypothetical protein [Halorhodospira halophila]MCG5533260.1 hypothetical protein [Halorhodospira sp. 9621]
MTNEILEERKRLLQELTKSTWLSAGISFSLAAIGGVIAYLIGIQRDLLPGAEQTLAVMIIAIALPAAIFVLVGLRKMFWIRAISAETERLQSRQFLTRYVEALGPMGLRSLSVIAKAQVDRALEREKNGEKATAREYAEALRYVLLIDPV